MQEDNFLNVDLSPFVPSCKQPDPRKNDPSYACLRVRNQDFFCTKANLIKYSNYLMRVFEKQSFSSVEQERKAQPVIHLPDTVKPDVLLLFLAYLD